MAQCRYQCGGRVFCRELAEHKQDKCPLRPVDAELESFMHKMEVKKERNKREVAALRQEFKQALHDERELGLTKFTLFETVYVIINYS